MTFVDDESQARVGVGARRTLLLSLLVASVGCPAPASTTATTLSPPDPGPVRDSGGSAAGGLGPPQLEEVAILTDAPLVPPPITRRVPAKVKVEIEVIEAELPISDGVSYSFWTFGGKVPGKFIRVRQGDTVELKLLNHPSSKMPHNIDLHAVTGPGGGAASTFTAPGHGSQFTFQALNQGLYVYHCATAPVGMHVANGMYGLILVEPPEGLPKVDREFYVMQGDFYTVGKYREKGHQPFDMQKAIEENATYVLFNGAEGSLLDNNALKAAVGERVRLFVGNGGPNLVSSFHVIGEVFDHVWTEGGTHVQENVQTTLVPAGGSAIVDFKLEVPGTYILVDHSIFRAFNKGAVGMIKVSGAERKDVYSGKEVDSVYLADKAASDAGAIQRASSALGAGTLTREQQVEAGRALFAGTCSACHGGEGKGLPGVFPPLAGSDFLNADPSRAIGVLLNGLSGKVSVNGGAYDSVMPPMSQLNDDEIANLLTFVVNSWGNSGGQISSAQVKERRSGTPRPAGAAR